MSSRLLPRVAFVVAAVLVPACAPAEDDDVAADEGALSAKKSDAVLGAVNTLSYELLRDDAKLPQQVLDGITIKRRGPDGHLGTADDVPFRSITELRKVPGVTTALLNDLSAWVLPRLDHPSLPKKDGWNLKVDIGDVHGYGDQAFNWAGGTANMTVDCSLEGLNPGLVTVTCTLKTEYLPAAKYAALDRTTTLTGLLVGDRVELTKTGSATRRSSAMGRSGSTARRTRTRRSTGDASAPSSCTAPATDP